MKQTVILDELLLSSLRSQEEYHHYQTLRQNELKALLIDPNADWKKRTACPVCDERSIITSFQKDSLDFHVCQNCYSIYADKVPSEKNLSYLLKTGKAFGFRRELSKQKDHQKNYQMIYQNLINWIQEVSEENSIQTIHYVDIDGDDFWHDILRQSPFFNEAKDQCNVVTDFFSLDKIANPIESLKNISERLDKNGLLFLSTSNAGCLEYQTLKENSPTFIPLDRLTVFSPKGIRIALEKLGFELIEISTPGRVDTEILNNYFNTKETEQLFWHYFFSRNNDAMNEELQLFLQKYLLCSYMRVAAKKI